MKQKSERKNSAQKDVWKIPGLEARCRELVMGGCLNREDGLQQTIQLIREEFAEKFGETKFTKEVMVARLPQIIWTPTVQREVRDAIRHRFPLDEFREKYFPYIPKKMWERKIKFFKGLSKLHISAKFVAGVGRFITDELGPDAQRFEFPVNDFEHPVEIPASKDWSLPIVNGANIGIVYDPNIEENPLRRALADAEKRGAAAVILTNLIDLYVKKTAGVGHIYRAQVSGLHVKLEHLPESYRGKAERILREHPGDEAVYQNIAARFLGILDALYKITHRPKKRGPEFTGKVFYVLGYKEEELINEAANAELRYINIFQQNKIRAELSVINRILAAAQRRGEDDRELLARREQLSQELATAILTNFSDEDRNRQRRRIRALFVTKIQEVIPNCTVVSQGSGYFKVGGRTVKIHVPTDVDVNDQHLSSYSYGFEVFSDTLADMTVICHPYSLNHRSVGREDSKDGQPMTKFVHVAPMCVDDSFLRDHLKNTTKLVHPIQKCVFNPQFRPGVLLVNSLNGVVGADSLPIPKLNRTTVVKDIVNFAYPYPDVSYINMFVQTDDHFGSRSKRRIWDPKHRIHLGVTEATIEMMRREGILNARDLPIHFAHQLDDPTQGNHFDTHNQPDPHEMSVVKIRRLMLQLSDDIFRCAERNDAEGVKNVTDELARVVLGQFDVRGLDWLFTQMMEVYDRQIEPNLDFWNAVLGRFERSKIKVRGISEITGVSFDSRDLGVINRATGNHFLRTLDNRLSEGEFYARHLRAMLGQIPHWNKKAAFLEKMIAAPRYSNETFGWGTVKAPGAFEWGIRTHSSPARLSSWSDTLAAVVQNDLGRGDDTYGLLKYITVTLYGDKHFYCDAETARMFYVMCAAGTHTDLYGTHGFPPNNTGVAFVCLPADGPAAGPVIDRRMPHDFLRDWFANPKPFNWAKFLPKPV